MPFYTAIRVGRGADPTRRRCGVTGHGNGLQGRATNQLWSFHVETAAAMGAFTSRGGGLVTLMGCTVLKLVSSHAESNLGIIPPITNHQMEAEIGDATCD